MVHRPICVLTVIAGLAVSSAAASAQEAASGADPDTLASQLIDEFLHISSRPPAKILILGTFHFRNSGRDDFQPEHEADVLSAPRQAEIADIVDRLAAFQPTKVAVEATADDQARLDEEFAAYVKGSWTLPANEIYQLGFRLAKRLGHAKVFGVDAPGRWFEPREDPTAYAREHDQARYLIDRFELGYDRLHRRLDEMKMDMTLRDYLLLLNADSMLTASHGQYIRKSLGVGDSEHYPGVDGFVSQWFNRNLRIVANIRRITEEPEERIVLIIGAGHVPILRQSFTSSPAYTVVDVDEYL